MSRYKRIVLDATHARLGKDGKICRNCEKIVSGAPYVARGIHRTRAGTEKSVYYHLDCALRKNLVTEEEVERVRAIRANRKPYARSSGRYPLVLGDVDAFRARLDELRREEQAQMQTPQYVIGGFLAAI